ncbi:MOS1T transposase, partial [Pseudoatta argentina]
YFIQKKSAAEAHRILVQTYGDNALSDTTCRDWFRRFKNNDFQLEDKERSGAPKKFQDKELEQLLDEKYYKLMSQLFQNNCLKGLGMIQKQGHWVPYESKPRTTVSTAEKKRFFASHRIVTGDEKWIHYDNLSFLRRSSKMDRFLDSRKRHVVFPTRDSCTARKMGESGL